MKPWKKMSKAERRAHVKETAEWIRKELEKDKQIINQIWDDARCLAANSKLASIQFKGCSETKGIFCSWI